jgi:lysophospholipase
VAKKKVAKKKKTGGAAKRELKAENKRLEAELAAAEKAAEKWKARAKDQKSSAAASGSELGELRRRLQKAEASATKWKDRAKAGVPSASAPQAETMAPAAGSTPDDSWTLTALRAEARARGMTGYSRTPKADLLAALRG